MFYLTPKSIGSSRPGPGLGFIYVAPAQGKGANLWLCADIRPFALAPSEGRAWLMRLRLAGSGRRGVSALCSAALDRTALMHLSKKVRLSACHSHAQHSPTFRDATTDLLFLN